MADTEKNEAEVPDANRNVVRIRTDHMTTAYSNFTVVSPTPEELSVLFGVHAMTGRPSREVEVDVSHRLIMTWPSAKRLAIALGNLIQRHEAAHGVIEVQPPPSIEPPARS